MKEFTKSNGWTISLYNDEGQSNLRDKGYDYLSWSPYDRIQVHITNNFERFIFPNDNWCGVKQQLHLLPHYYIIEGQEETANAEWRCKADETTDDYLVRRINSGDNYYGLHCIITVRLNGKVLTGIVNEALNNEKKEILKQVTENLSHYSHDNNLSFDCISFETLGSEDFAFILFADKIEIFSELLLILRRQTIQSYDGNLCNEQLFSEICSIMGFNKADYSYKPEISAIVKINAKSMEAESKIIKAVQKKSEGKTLKFPILQGMNVFEVHFKPKDLTLWHKSSEQSPDDNILNGESQSYHELISSSRTFWQTGKDIVQFQEYVVVKTVFVSQKDNECSVEYKVENQVLKFILNEYNRMIRLSRCVEWKKILIEQSDCLKAFNSYYYDTDNEKREFADGMHAVLTHINQACTPVYEVPYHNYFYAGSFDDILKTYYGIIHFIKDKGNNIQRESGCEPTNFSFGIRFDSVENIQTCSFSTERQEKRFVIFQLPYSALYDFETTAELLVHEVFHYIAPLNRRYRNKQMLNVWMEYLFLKLKKFMTYISKDTDSIENETIEKIINNPNKATAREHFLDLYYNGMSQMYEDLSIYELSVFTILEFAEDACTEFCKIFSLKLHETDFQSWDNLNQKAKNLSLRDEPNKVDAIDVLRMWLVSQDIFKGMIELAAAVKEIFCDLFMCALYQLDLKQYITLLKKYRRKQKVVILNDDLSLAYRIVIISSILRAEYNLEKITFSLSMRECKLIEQELRDNENITEYDDQVAKLISTINLVGTSPSICYAIIKTLEKEIAYLRDNLEEFGKTENELIKNIVTMSRDDSEIFSKQIKMMNCFMNYAGRQKENAATIQSVPHYSISLPRDCFHYATSTSEYLNIMINISRKSKGELWYRGVCNYNFSLLPSLLRNPNESLSLYAEQANYLKLAYSSTLNYPDMWNGKIQEHISLLQHYGMPTSLLDFSLDMLTALHFALNPDREDDKNKVNDGVWTPAVYAFDPNEYAIAIAELKKGEILNSQYNVSPILYELADDDMSEFFPKKMDANILIKDSQKNKKPYLPSAEWNKYPVPIIVRHSHARILVQGGTFVAYNLKSRPDSKHLKEETVDGRKVGPYSYLDLKQIELEYEEFQKNKGVNPIKKFLYEIHVAPSAIQSIQNDIRMLRITKSSVYPELHNIFEEAQKKLPGTVSTG